MCALGEQAPTWQHPSALSLSSASRHLKLGVRAARSGLNKWRMCRRLPTIRREWLPSAALFQGSGSRWRLRSQSVSLQFASSLQDLETRQLWVRALSRQARTVAQLQPWSSSTIFPTCSTVQSRSFWCTRSTSWVSG